MDFSDVIVHIFYEPVREFYDLDGLWGHAPKAKLPEPVRQTDRAISDRQRMRSPKRTFRLAFRQSRAHNSTGYERKTL